MTAALNIFFRLLTHSHAAIFVFARAPQAGLSVHHQAIPLFPVARPRRQHSDGHFMPRAWCRICSLHIAFVTATCLVSIRFRFDLDIPRTFFCSLDTIISPWHGFYFFSRKRIAPHDVSTGSARSHFFLPRLLRFRVLASILPYTPTRGFRIRIVRRLPQSPYCTRYYHRSEYSKALYMYCPCLGCLTTEALPIAVICLVPRNLFSLLSRSLSLYRTHPELT